MAAPDDQGFAEKPEPTPSFGRPVPFETAEEIRENHGARRISRPGLWVLGAIIVAIILIVLLFAL